MKKLLLITIALLLVAVMFADVTIGTGTSTQYYPFSSYYAYNRSSAIYLQSEIGAAMTIDRLAWYVSTANTTTDIPLKIYLMHTSATTQTAANWTTLTTGATLVYDATHRMNATGWYEINITDFAYNGTDNLMVLTESNGVAYTSPYAQMRYTSTSTNYRTLLRNSDTVPYDDTVNLSTSYNRPNIKLVTPVTTPPNAAITPFPADTATGVSGNPVLTWLSGGNAPTDYDVYFATAAAGLPITANANVATPTWTPPYTLLYNTTYVWKVVPHNANGYCTTGITTWGFTTMADPTIIPNWAESFDGTIFPPNAAWKNVKTAGTGTPGIWTRETAGTSPTCTPQSGAAMIRYNSSLLANGTKGELSTPPITFTSDDYRVSFWMYRGTEYSTYNQEVVNVYYSATGQTSVGATLLGTVPRYIGFAPIVDTAGWYNYKFNMPAGATGNGRYIIIEAVSQYGANIFLDDISIEQLPTTAVFNLTPDIASWGFGLLPINIEATKTFTVGNTGGADLTFTSVNVTGTYYSPLTAFDITPIPAGQSRDFTVKFLPTVAGGPYNGSLNFVFSRENKSVSFSGSAYEPATLPLTEDWESGQGDWIIANGTQINAWYIGTANPNSGAASAYVSNDAGVSNAYTITTTSVAHIYRDIAFTPSMMNFPLTFQWRNVGESTWDRMRVYLVDTSVTPVAGTELSSGLVGLANYSVQPTWTEGTITLPGTLSGTVKRLVFSWKNDSSGGTQPPINLDNISLTAVPFPVDPIFTLSPDVTSWDFGQTTVNTPATKQFTVTNNGGGTINLSSVVASGTYYTISVAPTLTALNYGESTSFTVQYLPTATGAAHPGTLTITDGRAVTTVSLTGSCVDPTIYASSLPYTQNFDAATVPALPLGWTKKVTDTSTYGYVKTVTGGISTPNRVEFYNSSDSASDLILITPLIDSAVSMNTLRVRFKAIGSASHTVQVGTVDVPGQSAVFTSLESVTLSSAWAEYTVPFTAYAGASQYIALRHGQGSTYQTLYVDDVNIELTPTAPVLGYAPATLAFGSTQANNPTEYQNVTVSNNGVGTLNLTAANISLIGTNPTEFGFTTTTGFPAALTAGQSVTIPVRFAPTTVGAKTAALRIAYNAVNYDVALTGNALSATALYESFEGTTFPPADWTVLNVDGGTQTWTRYTTTPRTGLACASIMYETAAHNDWLITPRLTIGASDYMFSFYAMNSGTYYQEKFNVKLSTLTNGVADFTNVIATGVAPTGDVYSLYSYDLSAFAGSDVYVGIQATETNQMRMFIDDVSGPSRYIATGPPEAVTLNTPANGATGLAKTGFNLTWTPALTGGTPTSYTVYMSTDEGTIYEDLNWTTTNTHFNPVTEVVGFTFDYLDYYFWTVKAINIDGNATVEPVWSFEIESDPFVPRTIPWTENFDAVPTPDLPIGWTVVDANADAYTWQTQLDNPRSAPNALRIRWNSTLDMDDYAISPPLALTGGVAYKVEFYYRAAGYDESLKLMMGTNPTAAAMTTTIRDLGAFDTDTYQRAFATFTPPTTDAYYLGWHGYSAADGFYLYVDDITVDFAPTGPPLAPTLTYPLAQTGMPKAGFNMTWTPNPTSGPTETYKVFVWKNSETMATGRSWTTTETSLNPVNPPNLQTPITFDYSVHYNWTVEAYHSGYPTAAAYPTASWFEIVTPITTFPWNDGFESYTDFAINFAPWTCVDVDGSSTYGMEGIDWLNEYAAQAYIIYNPSQTIAPLTGADAHGGNKYAACFAAVMPAEDGDGPNNDWLISPPVTVQNGLQFSFWAKSQTDEYGLERFKVAVSTTGTAPADFTVISGPTYLEAPIDWTQYSYPLSAYNGTTIYVAIQCVSEDAFFFMVDDVRLAMPAANLDAPVVTIENSVTGPALSWTAVTGANSYKVYGAADPYAADPWTLLTTTGLLTYTYTGTEAMHFFKVVADSAAPAKNVVSTRVNNLNGNASKRALAPKDSINLKNRK